MSNSLCRLLHNHCNNSSDPEKHINAILSDLSGDDVLDDVRDFMIRFRHSFVDNNEQKSPSHDNFVKFDIERQSNFWRGGK